MIRKGFLSLLLLGTIAGVGYPTSILAQSINSVSLIKSISNFSAKFFPTQQKKSEIIFAQGQSTQGGKRQMILFTREVGGTPTTQLNCPNGWTNVFEGVGNGYGYGPHFISILSYDWSGGGWGSGYWYPPYPPKFRGPNGEVPPDDGEPPPPPIPDVFPGPPTPGGGFWEGQDRPLPYDGTDPNGPVLPPYDGPVYPPGEGGNPYKPPAPSTGGGGGGFIYPTKNSLISLLGGLVSKAVAQVPYNYTIEAFSASGTSICSSSQQLIVPVFQQYQGYTYQSTNGSLFADSCFGPSCNRCKICVR